MSSHFKKLENMYLSAPFNGLFSPEISVKEGEAEITYEIKPDYFHAAFAVHGAVYFKAMDDAAFFAVNSMVEDVFVLTVSFTTYLTRPVSEGFMRATGRIVHQSRRLFLAEAVVVDDKGRQIARGNGSFMRSTMPLAPEIGYK
ncbi:MAG: PaaI family thioesterase [Rhodothermales bacterium]